MRSLVLHVLPGILTTAAFLVLKPRLDSIGYPPLLAFLLAVLLVDLPVMLGTLLYEGKRRHGRYSLEGVVLYRDRVSWRTFVLIFLGTFVATYALMMVTNPLGELLKESIFSWLPDWIFLEEQAQYRAYPRSVLLVTFALQLILTGVALPWVEELYFRGFLLPRLSRYRNWAPLLGGLLFGLYHVWQLFSLPTVFLLGAVLGYVVWWTRDIRISIALHVFANGVVRLIFLMTALAM
jgi:membrane protease YdiL (CAAX protease family)